MTPHKSTADQKATFTDRLAFAALIIIEKLLGLLPCSFVWRIGAALGAAAYPLSGKRRAIVLHNLGMVHPEASAEQLAQMSKSVFRNSYANLLCSLNTSGRPHRSVEDILILTDLHNIENITKDHGAILLLFHMGNWEILTKMHELIPNENPVGGMYRPLKNPLIDAHVKKQRESGGSQLFSRKRGLIRAQKFLKKGGFLGILCDQWAGGAGTLTDLFGKESSITPLPAILALKHQCPVIPVSLSTISPGHWEMRFHEAVHLSPELDKLSATEQLVKTMEDMMKAYSKDIFWMHDRWKIRPSKRKLARSSKSKSR
ncbi:MAG: lysophospholipid acyltransferase family protein [Akkermansiaceae bacterium]